LQRRPIILVLLALAAIGALAGYENPDIVRAWFGRGVDTSSIIVSGDIEAHQSVLSFKTVQSRIVELPFDEGQSVKTGTLLARVEDADYRQQVVIAQAALEAQNRQLAVATQNADAASRTVVSDNADMDLKQLDLDRAQSLLARGAGTEETRDQASAAWKQAAAALERDRSLEASAQRAISLAKANIDSADASLGMAKIVLGYATLTAPFDGVILVRQAELGEVTLPGAPVVTLADIDHVWLRAYVNEPDIGKVRHAESAAVTTDTYPGKIYKGHISFISSSAEFTPKSVETHAERVTLVYRIRIDIDNPSHELVPGMPADAKIQLLPAGPS
jgi:HlyD family secretion protein